MATGKGKGRGGSSTRQAKSKALAKRYQHDAAILKRKGILTSKVNARKNISRATRTKINKFRDVLEGRAIAVPAPRDVRVKYIESERLPVIGRFVMAPKQYAKSTAKVKRGMVAVTNHLPNGSQEYLVLPFKLTTLPDLLRRLKADPTLNGLKEPDEMFSFRMFGHNSEQSFATVESLADYIDVRYQHLFKRNDVGDFLTFQRWYVHGLEDRGPNPFRGTEPQVFGRVNAKGRNTGYTTSDRQRELAKKRQANRRARETPQQKALRAERDRNYSASRRSKQKGK